MILENKKSKICSQQATDTGELMYIVPLWKPAGWRLKKNWCSVQAQRMKHNQCLAQSSQAIGVPPYLDFLSYSCLQLIGWGPPTLRRVIYNTWLSLPIQMFISSRHAHMHNNVWPKVWVLHSPVKLTYKINRHRYTYYFKFNIISDLPDHFISDALHLKCSQ